MEENKEIDIYGSAKLKRQAGQWLEKQDMVTLMNRIGLKLQNKIDCSLEIDETISIESKNSELLDSSGEMAAFKDNCDQRAYRIKLLAETETDPNVSSLLKEDAEFCVKLYKINQLLSNYIKEQKMTGQFVKTTFKEGNSLNQEYVYKLFRNAFCDVRNYGYKKTNT